MQVHIISRKALKEFWAEHLDSKTALLRWYKIVDASGFDDFASLRLAFPNADKVGRSVVFNIGGNKYRLIAVIHFNRQKVYIRHVLTHKQYDKGDWK